MDTSIHRHKRAHTNGASRRIFVIVLGATLLTLGLVSYGFRALKAGTLYSSPTAVRTTNTLFTLQQPAQPKPETDWTVFDSMSVSNSDDGSQITLRFTNDWSSDHGLRAFERHEINHDEILEIDGGRISLHRVSVGYGPPAEGENVDWGYRVEPKVFHGDLSPLTEEELENAYENQWQRQVDVSGGFPTVRFEVMVEGLGPLKNLGGQFVDATTGEQLSSGYSYGDRDNLVYIEVDLETWRPHPILFVIDIAHGPTEEELVPAEPGARIQTVSADLTLLTINDGESSGSGSRSQGNSEEIYWKFRSLDDPERKYATAIFLGYPTANPVPADFDFLDANGEALPEGGGGAGSRSKYVEIRDHWAEDVKTIKVTKYLKVRRLIFRLPYLPGMPEVNANVDNLFDMRIPYLHLDSKWRLREALSGAIQMSLPWSSGTATNAPVYPIVLTNATPRDLIPYWERELNAAGPLIVDPETGKLVVAKPLWQRVRDRIQALIQ